MTTRALAIALIAASSPATAWEAGRIGATCILDHRQDGSGIRLTYDPAGPIYTITWTIDGIWPEDAFAITFDGAQPNTITTNRHVVSEDRQSLTVTDRGFGNVLDGLRFNTTATAISGNVSASVSLDGAAPEVEAFLACEQAPSV